MVITTKNGRQYRVYTHNGVNYLSGYAIPTMRLDSIEQLSPGKPFIARAHKEEGDTADRLLKTSVVVSISDF